MRVLYLTEEAITFSGIMVSRGEIHVRNIVEGLRKKGQKVHLVDWHAEPEQAFIRLVSGTQKFAFERRKPTEFLKVNDEKDARQTITTEGDLESETVFDDTKFPR